eukprot:1392063-Lingulodinium_polyedra.AAC.1
MGPAVPATTGGRRWTERLRGTCVDTDSLLRLSQARRPLLKPGNPRSCPNVGLQARAPLPSPRGLISTELGQRGTRQRLGCRTLHFRGGPALP